MKTKSIPLFAFLFLSFVLARCGTKTTASLGLPSITPPVKAAVPKGMAGGSSRGFLRELVARSLDSSDVKTRFFVSGPTNLFSILATVDSTISGINVLTGTCTSQTPVSYNITPFGQTVAMYAQCAKTGTASYTGDPALTQFGSNNNNVYFYVAQGAERLAAIVTPVDSTGAVITAPTTTPTAATPISASTYYKVETWIGVGYNNSPHFESGSYGVIHLVANSATKTFEMAVGGTGFGYCGFQMKSDGTNIYGTGSLDMGATCGAIDTLCVLAADGTSAGTCGAAVTTFALTPLGRHSFTGSSQSFGASTYPASGLNVTLTGAAGDSLYFGPTTATTGVGTLASH